MTEKWRELDDVKRRMHILRLLNATDVCDNEKRMDAIRAILYLAQGKKLMLPGMSKRAVGGGNATVTGGLCAGY